jgi:hypothetical protein
MASKSNLEKACEIWWGEFVDPDICNLTSQDNPEKEIILKDLLENFSKEMKVLANTIITLPEEMFTKTGLVIHKKLVVYMKVHYGWTALRTTTVQSKITKILTN